MNSSTNNNSWHLAESKLEIQFTEFELLLWRVFHSFLRWQEDCENRVNNLKLNAQELAILHIIRMQNRPKSLYQVSSLLNRNDISNIKYSIRKLLEYGLIDQVGTVQKEAIYAASEAGIKDTNIYSRARKDILINALKKETGLKLDVVISTLTKLISTYENSRRIAATYKPSEE